MYLLVSSSIKCATRFAMSVERMDVAIMRTTKPRAMPTILRLIDWLNMGALEVEKEGSVRSFSA
jgi:hypothetical protein